jgi:hypothetical protein
MAALMTFMTPLTKRIVWLALLLASSSNTGAFSLLGPFKQDAAIFGTDDNWQAIPYDERPQGLGYQLSTDIGGPMLPIEAYRWNVPLLTYAFDLPFLRYFGTNGVAAIEEAFAILNALPPASQMSATLSEFPLDTKFENGTAAQLGLLDLKSHVLSLLVEEMGLANPERFVWGLRGRETGNDFTNYSVIQLNYDPVTTAPSRYVNGVLYNYKIFDDLGPVGGEWASAVEWYQLDPLFLPYTSVAGGIGSAEFQLGSEPADFPSFFFGLNVGQYFTGLTRDDVGGLRYLLSTNNIVFETLLPTLLPRTGGGRGGSPWAPILSTNVFGTNATGVSNIISTVSTNLTNFFRPELRAGIDKISFRRVNLIGTNFAPITLRYTDRFINVTNGRIVRQSVERVVFQPDIIFTVRDLGTVFEVPRLSVRSTTTNWINNAAANSFFGEGGLGGPGVITPSVVITFGDLVPYYLNLFAGGTQDDDFPVLWGSFDGTDRPPVVYPVFPHPLAPDLSLDYLRDVVLRRNRN